MTNHTIEPGAASPNNNGAKVNPTETHAKTPHTATTIFTLLRGHGVGAMQPSLRALSEGCARVGSQGHWSSEEPEVSGCERSPNTNINNLRLVTAGGLSLKIKTRGAELLSVEKRHIDDQGQISRMMLARLERHGLLENAGGPPQGANAWRLTPRGEELIHTSFQSTGSDA